MQGGSYTAQQDRINHAAALFDEGVKSRRDLKVSQRAAGANMTVDIAAGACIITGDDQANQGNYDVFSDAVGSVSGFVATSSNTRYDLVGIQLNDPNAGGAAGSNAVFARVAGTQAASPVIPAIPNSFYVLAIVGPFTTSTSSITNSMIHDAWTGTGPTGVTTVRLLRGLKDNPGTSKESWNPIAANGWLVEDGSAVSRTTYADLFEHFGTTFGAGDGSTTFNLPDSRGRVLVALDNQGGSDAGRLVVANTLGGSGGEETHVLTGGELAAHQHGIDPPSTALSITDPGHSHNMGIAVTADAQIGGSTSRLSLTGALATGSSGTGISGTVDIASFNSTSTGSGNAHNNMQPYIFCYRHVRT